MLEPSKQHDVTPRHIAVKLAHCGKLQTKQEAKTPTISPIQAYQPSRCESEAEEEDIDEEAEVAVDVDTVRVAGSRGSWELTVVSRSQLDAGVWHGARGAVLPNECDEWRERVLGGVRHAAKASSRLVLAAAALAAGAVAAHRVAALRR